MSPGKAVDTSALVSLEAVSVVFGGTVRALDDVTLSLAKGDVLGLVGESGSGKTTLCRVVIGLTAATSGTVSIGGISVGEQMRTSPLAFRRRTQMLLQGCSRLALAAHVHRPIAGRTHPHS